MEKRRGYSLIELIVVIAIIGLLVAIIFPIISAAREKSRQSACISNLHQIGISILLYSQDNDNIYPLGGDITDTGTHLWQSNYNGKYAINALSLLPLEQVLLPYTHSKAIWHCPSDTGFNAIVLGGYFIIPAHPSAWNSYGSSYLYHTILALANKSVNSSMYDDFEPFTSHSPSEVDVIWDASPWHSASADKQFNVLMGDGRIETQSSQTIDENLQLIPSIPTNQLK